MSVRNGIVLFLALSTLSLLVGCGSSSPTPQPPPSGGFTASSLNGTYVFSSAGADSTNGPGFLIAFAGTITANGSGGITGGTLDIIGPDITQATPVAQPITGGTYTVTADGRGQIKLASATFNFVLTSSSHGLITEFDGNGSGSGTIDLQTAATPAPSTSYAFSLSGSDGSTNLNPMATAGSFTLDASGNPSTGIQDFVDDTFVYLGNAISPGVFTPGTGTGPGSFTFVTTGAFPATLTFDVYTIDATHMKFIETDYLEFLAGDAFTQTAAAIPTGPMVFTVAGVGANGTIGGGGLMTSDGTGNFTNGLEDVNDGGNVSPQQLAFTGTAAGPAGAGGRVLVNFSGFDPAIQYVLYPIVGGALMMETDSGAITTGTAYAQTSQTLQASQGYGLNLSAFNTTGFEGDDIAEFVTTSSAFSGIVDVNDEGQLTPNQSFNGTYSADSPATGRGEATTTAGGNAFISFGFYVVNSSTVLILESDTNQIGVGTIELQTTPGGTPATAHPVVSVVHPVARAKGAAAAAAAARRRK